MKKKLKIKEIAGALKLGKKQRKKFKAPKKNAGATGKKKKVQDLEFSVRVPKGTQIHLRKTKKESFLPVYSKRKDIILTLQVEIVRGEYWGVCRRLDGKEKIFGLSLGEWKRLIQTGECILVSGNTLD